MDAISEKIKIDKTREDIPSMLCLTTSKAYFSQIMFGVIETRSRE